MSITIGIDIGGSTTKIIGVQDGAIVTPMLVRATDPIASLFGAFGKFIDGNSLPLKSVEQIMITGVGASYISKPIYGLPTARVEEFLANGLGGLFLTGMNHALIVSMGTGTALVEASEESIKHIGGTGVGGGTILGLSSRMLNIRDIELIIKTAEDGDLSHVDLMVGDLTRDVLPGLPPYTTASNFGRISDVATSGDIALGIINLVLQAIGMTAIFAARGAGVKDVALIGNLSVIPQCRDVFEILRQLFSINFIIPGNAEYATAVGAALAYVRNKRYDSITGF
ncbi:MAG: type II pantothenate kinase [Clostridiales bacterium]|jgi:type II pantothenate kinase|nr:type II pantothenate kinase [Clostridiales bacterium]